MNSKFSDVISRFISAGVLSAFLICMGVLLIGGNALGQIKHTSTKTVKGVDGTKTIITYRSYENGDESEESVILNAKGKAISKDSKTVNATGETTKIYESFDASGKLKSRIEVEMDSAGKMTRFQNEKYQDGILVYGAITETGTDGKKTSKKYDPATERYVELEVKTASTPDFGMITTPKPKPKPGAKTKIDSCLVGKWRSEPAGTGIYSGGGIVFTVEPDGMATFDYDGLKPFVKPNQFGGGNGIDTIKITGKATGQISSDVNNGISVADNFTSSVTEKETYSDGTTRESKPSGFFPNGGQGTHFTCNDDKLIFEIGFKMHFKKVK
ncbi:MAG: hypothetical protein M3R69_02665 [Acidobacteriota bacterium]|nr:hypothetical protein [Acidobacteriota bacterium]